MTSTSNPPRVRLLGTRTSARAYELRDFLGRSTVEFDWIDLQTPEGAAQAGGYTGLGASAFPVVEFPDGERLYSPNVAEVAARLGWVTQPKRRVYDLSIYGAGPAGLSAAVYAASEGLRTVLIERDAIGGQAGTSSLIENYLGFPAGVSGAELAERARQQAVKFGAEILQMRGGVKACFQDGGIVVDLTDGTQLRAACNLCATGVEYTRLNIPGEELLLGRGFYYGAGVAEAPACAGETVLVIGGGNSAGQAAVHLARYAARVVMLVRGTTLSATLSSYLQGKIEAAANVEVWLRHELVKVEGEGSLQEVTVRQRDTGDERAFRAQRVFVCIGGTPNTEWARDTPIVRDDQGYLVTGRDLLADGRPPVGWPLTRLPFELETSVPGSFAAGDVRHGSVKRVATAVGEGAMAVVFVHRHLAERG